MSAEVTSDSAAIKRKKDQRRGTVIIVVGVIAGIGWWIVYEKENSAYADRCKAVVAEHEKHPVEFKKMESGSSYRDRAGFQVAAAWSRFSYRINYPVEWQLRSPKSYVEDAVGVVTCFSNAQNQFVFAESFKKGFGKVCFAGDGKPDFGCF